jgi:3-hydroxybutyryl-CoA dehydratase
MSQGISARAVGDSFAGFERLVTQERVTAYAEASGDHNPIHLDEVYAATTQFGTRIAHGMLSLALVTEMLAIEFPNTWHSGGKLKVRFTAPIIPGETVTTWGEITSIDVIHDEKGEVRVATCTVGCKKPDGTDAVAGRAMVPLE